MATEGVNGSAGERRCFYRSPYLPGIELLEATDSTGSWSVVHSRLAMAIPEEWAARLNRDGRHVNLDSGQALLVRPGEVNSTPGSACGGTIRVMIFSAGAFSQQFGAHVSKPGEPNWRTSMARCSTELTRRFAHVFRVLGSGATAMELQSAMAELGAILVPELVSDTPSSPPANSASSRHASRMREVIHHAPRGLTLSLDELAMAVGLNRFQALRSFKKRYGLPPHTYQLVTRTHIAMSLLRRGMRATDVAHELGFADHSHFSRHFKRILGLTPREYAAAGRRIGSPCKLVSAWSDGLRYSYT